VRQVTWKAHRIRQGAQESANDERTFTPKFKKAWDEAGEQIDGLAARSRVASIEFQVRNKVRAAKDMRRYRDDDGELPQGMKDGGYVESSLPTH
jgi:hypothetical protein